MTSTQIETFSAEHLAGAAAVLLARHTDHLAQPPLLAPGDARAALKDFWDKKGRFGAVAIRGGRVVGFVLAEIMAHPLFGDCAWVAHPGHAADDGELLRDLYSAAAEVWVESGADRHYVLVPAYARALEPWYRLGFGHMHVEALRPISVESAAALAGMTLRRGRRDDLENAEAIDLEFGVSATQHSREVAARRCSCPFNRQANESKSINALSWSSQSRPRQLGMIGLYPNTTRAARGKDRLLQVVLVRFEGAPTLNHHLSSA